MIKKILIGLGVLLVLLIGGGLAAPSFIDWNGYKGQIAEQVRRLPNYQIDWPVVHDEMHFLRHEFQKLRRLANKCLALVTSEEHRRVIRDLNAHIDREIDVCISLGG